MPGLPVQPPERHSWVAAYARNQQEEFNHRLSPEEVHRCIDSDIPPVSLDSNRHLLVEYYASCIRLTGPSRPEVSSAESFVK
jgi:hypothetical protein